VASIVPRFDFRIGFSVCEDIGRARSTYEDVALLEPGLALFVVADGMGGHPAGEVAARLAVDEVKAAIADDTSQRICDQYCARPDLDTRRNMLARLKRVMERANEKVRQEADLDPARRGMGTTLDVVWLARDRAFVAHAGDSRVYLARSNAVLQLTQDHAQLESLKADGKLGPRLRAQGHNRLINAIGIADVIAADALFVDLARGDRLLLCSDGVHDQLDGESELAHLLRLGSTEDAAHALVGRAGQKGRDNATAVVIEIGDRFVKRPDEDRGLGAADLQRAGQSPLLSDLPQPLMLEALAAAVEIELEAGASVPRVIASDLVAYIVLDGILSGVGARNRQVGTGALVFPESLVGVWGEGPLPTVSRTARLLRVRADDFEEVCDADPALAGELYRRLARHIARISKRTDAASDPPQAAEPDEQEAAPESPKTRG
jgi:serine/threonine protein phosphatase PrpC